MAPFYKNICMAMKLREISDLGLIKSNKLSLVVLRESEPKVTTQLCEEDVELTMKS